MSHENGGDGPADALAAAARTQLEAPARFLAAWKRGIAIVGEGFFHTRRPGIGVKSQPLPDLALIRDKWQACPNHEAVEAGIRALSSGEATLLAAMCSFYNEDWGARLLREVAGVEGLASLSWKLDDEALEVVIELMANYTGW